MRAIIKRADEAVGHVEEIQGDLENLQKIVGGHVTCMTYYKNGHPWFAVLCDEEGLLKMHPVLNCGIRYGARAQYFVGDILAVGLGDEDFDDLPEEITIEEWEKMLVTGKKLMRLIYLPYYDDEDEDEEDEEDEQID